MRIEVTKNRAFLKLPKKKLEIHPLWLRERAKTKELVDENNHQRLYDPSQLDKNLKIKKISMNNGNLNIEFTDGIRFKYGISDLIYELSKKEAIEKIILWNSNIKRKPIIKYEKNIFESRTMYDVLQDFYKYGFIIFKKVPTEDNYVLKFANSIGTVRPTNFGETFSVKSVPKPNDLAYTSIALSPHTDNPYRKPMPGIQILHCIANEAKGGDSSLVDGYAVAEHLKKEEPEMYEILTTTNVLFKFVDQDIILENYGKLIELDDSGNYVQSRFSGRLDYVPYLEPEKLESFYAARKKLYYLYESEEFELNFRLESGMLMMFDNIRVLHGRTEYDVNTGFRHLQGCYIDHDSTEGKLRRLKSNL